MYVCPKRSICLQCMPVLTPIVCCIEADSVWKSPSLCFIFGSSSFLSLVFPYIFHVSMVNRYFSAKKQCKFWLKYVKLKFQTTEEKLEADYRNHCFHNFPSVGSSRRTCALGTLLPSPCSLRTWRLNNLWVGFIVAMENKAMESSLDKIPKRN